MVTEDLIQLERTYGDKHYDERLALLDTLLDELDHQAGVDLDRVFEILYRAWRINWYAARGRQFAKQRREFLEESRLIKKELTKWLRRAQRFYGPLDPPEQTLHLLQDLIIALTDDSVPHPKAHRRLRSKLRGRPEKTWNKRARKELAAAGISQALTRDELLMVIGLIPYRHS